MADVAVSQQRIPACQRTRREVPADRRSDNGLARGAARSAAPGRGQPRCRIAPSAVALLEAARRGLAEAAVETSPLGRYVAAHLAALRAAAAVVAARGDAGRGPRRRRPRSVWELLPQAEPPLTEWAAFFAAGAAKRAAAEAGLPHAATPREADELLRDAEIFVAVVADALGLPDQVPFPLGDQP